MKNLFILIFSGMCLCCQAQTKSDSLVSLTHPSQTDSLKSEILFKAATALNEGKYAKYILYFTFIVTFEERKYTPYRNFKEYYETVFPQTLKLHIDNKTWCRDAALEIKKELEIERI